MSDPRCAWCFCQLAEPAVGAATCSDVCARGTEPIPPHKPASPRHSGYAREMHSFSRVDPR